MINGVAMPKLRSKNSVSKLARDLLSQLGVGDAELVEGEAATADIPALLRRVLERDRNNKDGVLRKKSVGDTVLMDIAVEGDAHLIHRGVSVTRMVFRWRETGGTFQNTPYMTHSFLLVDGNDKWVNLHKAMEVPMKKLLEVSGMSHVQVPRC